MPVLRKATGVASGRVNISLEAATQVRAIRPDHAYHAPGASV